MTNAAQKPVVENSILTTAFPMTPVAVGYNIESTEIENFVFDYLTKTRGIQGVATVRLKVGREGGKPSASIFAFFDINSPDIYTGNNKIPSYLRNKIDMDNARVSDRLFNALKPLINRNKFKLHNRSHQGLAFIELDIFKVFGLATAIDPERHELIINEARQVKKNRAIISVMKVARAFEQGESILDRYDQILRNMD